MTSIPLNHRSAIIDLIARLNTCNPYYRREYQPVIKLEKLNLGQFADEATKAAACSKEAKIILEQAVKALDIMINWHEKPNSLAINQAHYDAILCIPALANDMHVKNHPAVAKLAKEKLASATANFLNKRG